MVKHVCLVVLLAVFHNGVAFVDDWVDTCRPLDGDQRPPFIVDASVRFPDGRLYVFSGDRVARISNQQIHNLAADRGWPKLISEVWPTLPPDIEAAFTLNRQVFLIKVKGWHG